MENNSGLPATGTENNSADSVGSILSMVANEPSMQALPEIENLLKVASDPKFSKSPGAANADTEVEENEEEAPVSDGKKKTTTAKYKSTFFGEENKESKVAFKEGTDISAYMKKAYGVEKPQEFFKQFGEYKKAADENVTLKAQTKEFQTFFETLPEELFSVFQAYQSKGDWKAAMGQMANQSVDYNKDYTQQDKFAILNHYFPDKFSKEDFSDIDNNVALAKSLEMSKSYFERDKTTKASEKESAKIQLMEKNELVRSSIATSLEKLKASYPNMTQSAIKDISRSMATGDYRDLFFNADGTFTEEAAGRLAMAKYGDEEIRNAVKAASKQVESDTTKKIVERSDSKANIKEEGQEKGNGLNKGQAGFLADLLKNNNVYAARPVA